MNQFLPCDFTHKRARWRYLSLLELLTVSRATLGRNKKNKISLSWSFILKWTKRLLKYGEERSVVCNCTHEEKMKISREMVPMATSHTFCS